MVAIFPYPVLKDMSKMIGKMSEFRDEITLAQLKQKLFDTCFPFNIMLKRKLLFQMTDC